MSGALPDPGFWAGKRVLLTGHTGFKGGWLLLWLQALGAKVTGMSLPPEGPESLFEAARLHALGGSHFCDLRNEAALSRLVAESRPQIVLHLAAQALVRQGYRDPAGTFATNVQGTVTLLAGLARQGGTEAILVVTSDKVYANDERGRAFAEEDRLGGHDPYSLSKAAAEFAVDAFRAAGLSRLATARAGNVIGGGDFGADRLVPDLWRAARAGNPILLRYPQATRPWQHVLDCLCGYLIFAERLAKGLEAPSSLNIGPDPGTPIPVSALVEVIGPAMGLAQGWRPDPLAASAPAEMRTLSLDPAKARALGIRDRLPGLLASRETAQWYADYAAGAEPRSLCEAAIARYAAWPAEARA